MWKLYVSITNNILGKGPEFISRNKLHNNTGKIVSKNFRTDAQCLSFETPLWSNLHDSGTKADNTFSYDIETQIDTTNYFKVLHLRHKD
jgi:hypothetical protein